MWRSCVYSIERNWGYLFDLMCLERLPPNRQNQPTGYYHNLVRDTTPIEGDYNAVVRTSTVVKGVAGFLAKKP